MSWVSETGYTCLFYEIWLQIIKACHHHKLLRDKIFWYTMSWAGARMLAGLKSVMSCAVSSLWAIINPSQVDTQWITVPMSPYFLQIENNPNQLFYQLLTQYWACCTNLNAYLIMNLHKVLQCCLNIFSWIYFVCNYLLSHIAWKALYLHYVGVGSIQAHFQSWV